MKEASMRALGDLEAAVMDQMWSADSPLTVREVLGRLERTPPLAYTTVMTTVERLFRKGFLDRELEGRTYRYEPTKGRAEHTAEMMHELLSDSQDSSVTLSMFLDRMSAKEVAKLKKALDG